MWTLLTLLAAAALADDVAVAPLIVAREPDGDDPVKITFQSKVESDEDWTGFSRARAFATHGRWDAELWGAGGLPSGAFADGADADGKTWRSMHPSDALRGAHVDAFRRRCAPAAAARNLSTALVLQAKYASLGAEAFLENDVWFERRKATLVVPRRALEGTPWATNATRRRTVEVPGAPILLDLHAAARDRSRGFLVYKVTNNGDVRRRLNLRIEIPAV
eukprot:CAMPEP_0119294580 /NCGR_PEP_ID=MMETSP1329-20130426/48271_1 /TAXON_ID=114041 /ORGANISM="Genus nov. species nov., Strain RCC1024" /LENGTH=219 /DNA_ID=CAMNT_0007295473 /DNA_START=40 /DNA_END=696 /DNA_ORIENTATION=+